MNFIPTFSALRLDIVGIVAILGEASTSRNAQASSLSWWHTLPRLYPAPQVLLKQYGDDRLPIAPGIVIGAHSGRIRHELNFFTQLLHPENLPRYSVEILRVARIVHNDDKPRPAFQASNAYHLWGLSCLGCAMSITLLGLSIWQRDGPALVATVLLSVASGLAGLASWATLDYEEEEPDKTRQKMTPLSDIIIFYPKQGAFRVIRCNEATSRLYFRIEKLKHHLDDNIYRLVAFFATFTLMAGLIMLGNSQPILQAAFAASYVALNGLYWVSSAMDPFKHVWESDFKITELGFTRRMVRDLNGHIVPEYSNLSPPNAFYAKQIKAQSLSYHRNRHWEDTKDMRTPTFVEIQREEEGDMSSEEKNPCNKFIQSVFHLVGITKRPSGTYILPPWPDSIPRFRPALIRLMSHDTSNIMPKRNFTSALWTVVALTGSSRWARTSQIAPDTEAWDNWLEEAEAEATARRSIRYNAHVPPCLQWEDVEHKLWIQLPHWDYNKRLDQLLQASQETTRTKFDTMVSVTDVELVLKDEI